MPTKPKAKPTPKTDTKPKMLCEAFVSAINEVCPDWKKVTEAERDAAWKKACAIVVARVVDKRDGGKAKDGLSMWKFNDYRKRIEWTCTFDVPLAIAEKAKLRDLLEAYEYVRENMKDDDGDKETKMVRAYEFLMTKRALLDIKLKQSHGMKLRPSEVRILETASDSMIEEATAKVADVIRRVEEQEGK